MARITTFLMLNEQPEVVAKHYTSIFKNSKVVSGTPTVIELDGFQLFLYNGGEYFKDKLGEGMSLFVSCETQAEVDYYWDKLLEGGKPSQCGWLKDKFGVSW